jgi:activating signal cointegrator 1
MLALSLTQPWATLVTIGAKHIETRSWAPHQRCIGQRIAIHAAKGFPRKAKECCWEELFTRVLWPDLFVSFARSPEMDAALQDRIGKLPRGVVLCTAKLCGAWSTNNEELVDRLSIQERLFGSYAPDRWMWVLEDIQPLPEPIPARGALGLWKWDVPPEIMAAVAINSGVPA